MRALDRAELVFGVGPAGTGKTYLAVAHAAQLLERGQVERIILSRPAVEAGERLGFLPGDMKEKVDPYLRPLYDALYDMMPGDKVERALTAGVIEIAPLAFMRGRTLANAAVILDEAQNTTSMQMKMFLTRLGENARMIVTGDPTPDRPAARRQVRPCRGAARPRAASRASSPCRFEDVDVVRHPLVGRIVAAYDAQSCDARATAADPTEADPARPMADSISQIAVEAGDWPATTHALRGVGASGARRGSRLSRREDCGQPLPPIRRPNSRSSSPTTR